MTAPTMVQENICSMCNQTEDEGEEDNIWWIQCSSSLCSREYHLSCVGLTIDTLPKKRHRWYCPFCSHDRQERKLSSPYRRNKEKQPNQVINEFKQIDTLGGKEDTDISIKSLAPVQSESTDMKKNLVSFLFQTLISFLLAYIVLSYWDFNTFVRY